ncbi:MAG: SPOR domain-containing protein [bacterium]
MDIQKYISDLLSEHDCVIIPGLGGFVGSYLPAQIHPVYHTFQPPSKKILFNINLKQNDGLLANHIVQAEKTSFNDANEKIRLFADETLRVLKSRKYLILQNIGKLYMGKEGNIQFDQDLRANLLPESFGLQPFFSAPVKPDANQEKVEKRLQLRSEHKKLVRKAIPKSLKWAAILAIPVAVAVLLSLAGYDSIKSGSWNYADLLSSLSPFTTAEKKTAPAETQVVSFPEETSVNTDPVSRELTQNSTREEQPGKFAVIVGAFRIEENAHKLVKTLTQQGIKALIFDRSSGGLSRVAAGVFTERNEALNMMSRMKSEGCPGAWLLEK